MRLQKAEEELSKAQLFDYVVVNDDLSKAIAEVEALIIPMLRK